jgi:hypothetical protein
MVDTARTRFPDDMTRAADFAGGSELDHYATEVVESVKQYARDQPVSFALWAFGIGFVLGWKLKPW